MELKLFEIRNFASRYEKIIWVHTRKEESFKNFYYKITFATITKT